MTETLPDTAPPAAAVPADPDDECDVVMKGGITSGVIYPTALHRIGSRYRIRGIGGASAGAIGAAVGAAAEFARSSGGFERLHAVPTRLGEGRLATLFQPEASTRQLLSLMLVATGSDRPGGPRARWRQVVAILGALVRAFPIAALVGVLPWIALAVVGVLAGGWAGWLLAAAGAVLLVVGWLVSMLVRLWRKFTVHVPGNLFGICRGLGRDPEHPGFTDWLCDTIDEIAGLPVTGPPLTFGQLWADAAGAPPASAADRRIDLRMITTCLSEGRPYEMPWEARRFFFDPAEWRTLFPERVVAALLEAPTPRSSDRDETDRWRWEEQVAAQHEPPLHRLPDAQHLPLIVATRLSLSFPLLIAAVPLWTIDHRNPATQDAFKRYRAARRAGTVLPTSGLQFCRLWFTDGGFCSNFPVHLFDAALPSRPTFAINLGRFPGGQVPDEDQRLNVEWARNNRNLLPSVINIPTRGISAVGGFASAAINTSRNWQDSSHLDHPGYRDRIVRVLHSQGEGGLNLHMDTATIDDLTARGRTAADVIIEQFTEPRYPEQEPTATGWDNHRWVRYRALLSVLPGWLQSYRNGRALLEDIDAAGPPSYRLGSQERELARRLTAALDELADIAATADAKALNRLAAAPQPRGMLRRIPQT